MSLSEQFDRDSRAAGREADLCQGSSLWSNGFFQGLSVAYSRAANAIRKLENQIAEEEEISTAERTVASDDPWMGFRR